MGIECCTGNGFDSNAQHVSSATDDVLQKSESASISGSVNYPELMVVLYHYTLVPAS